MLHNALHVNSESGPPISGPQALLDELLRVRDDLGRIATLMVNQKAPQQVALGAVKPPPGTQLERDLRAIARARAKRSDYFAKDLFADPAWDMLIELYRCRLAQVRISVSSLCAAAEVPSTTALRWMKTLEQQNLIFKNPDKYDARRVWVELTDDGKAALENYFEAIKLPLEYQVI